MCAFRPPDLTPPARGSATISHAVRLGRQLGLAALLGLGHAQAAQLTFSAGSGLVTLDGRATSIPAPQVIGGLTMLPLRETAALFGRSVTVSGSQVQLGNLTVDAATGAAYVAGQPQAPGSTANQGGRLYVSAQLLASGLGGRLSVNSAAGGRQLSITTSGSAPVPPAPRPSAPSSSPAPAPAGPQAAAMPSLPQARFSTDKAVYAPGERIVYTEYSFDPESAAITGHKWTGRQDTFFQPGTYTVTLQSTNARGQTSAPYSRTVRVQGAAVDTPLTFALRHAPVGDRFADSRVLTYPAVNQGQLQPRPLPLLFSDSPEKPAQSGMLYQDRVSGEARLLGYHINGLPRPARLLVMARNVGGQPVSVTVAKQGDTAPSRIEGILGQVTLMDYFSSPPRGSIGIAPGQTVPLYASPSLAPGSGVSLIQDIVSTGPVQISFVMLEDGVPPTAEVISALPYLPLDGRHQRGTFQGADRPMSTALTQFPVRVVIGDGQHDPVITGTDAVSQIPQRLAGNYGVLYDMEFTGAAGTAIALSPRGGLYRGAMRVEDGGITQTIKLPRTGNALTPDEPVLLWRTKSDRVRIQFMPANGSALPVNLVFYRLPENTYKWYLP